MPWTGITHTKQFFLLLLWGGGGGFEFFGSRNVADAGSGTTLMPWKFKYFWNWNFTAEITYLLFTCSRSDNFRIKIMQMLAWGAAERGKRDFDCYLNITKEKRKKRDWYSYLKGRAGSATTYFSTGASQSKQTRSPLHLYTERNS